MGRPVNSNLWENYLAKGLNLWNDKGGLWNYEPKTMFGKVDFKEDEKKD